MTESGPAGGSRPLEGLPFFSELARVPDVEGPVHWEVARRVAVWVAGGGRPEPLVDPAWGARLQEIGRVAELQMAEALPAQMVAGKPVVVGEAVRRRRAEASWGDRYVARLLGTGLRQPAYERGRRFVLGVIERAGEQGLARLWTAGDTLPTPAEVDAPGLWLARIDLPGSG